MFFYEDFCWSKLPGPQIKSLLSYHLKLEASYSPDHSKDFPHLWLLQVLINEPQKKTAVVLQEFIDKLALE